MKLGTLQWGWFRRRYQRFFMEVEKEDGKFHTIHCPNTGSMRSLLEPGTKAWFSTSPNPARKLPHTLEILELPGGVLAYVNTIRCNSIVREALEQGFLQGYSSHSEIATEVSVKKHINETGSHSRIDFCLKNPTDPPCWLEVKNTTLMEKTLPGVAQFPDAITTRGLRHLKVLTELRQIQQRAIILYLVNRSDVSSFKVAKHLDPDYAQNLQWACTQNVEALAWQTKIKCTENQWFVEVWRELPIV